MHDGQSKVPSVDIYMELDKVYAEPADVMVRVRDGVIEWKWYAEVSDTALNTCLFSERKMKKQMSDFTIYLLPFIDFPNVKNILCFLCTSWVFIPPSPHPHW